MPNGVTNLMRNIRKPAPEWVHKHFVPETIGPDKKPLPISPADKHAADLQPYVNPERDLRKGRRLRKELAQ